MSDIEQPIWGIHGGKTGDADTLFLKRNFIALGWQTVGNPGHLLPTRDAFKKRVADAFPAGKPGSIANSAGQLFRFVHEMKIGDTIAYPSQLDRCIHLGTVAGEYTYDPQIDEGYPNLRAVKWHQSVPRTHFSQGALYEIGAAMSLFQIKNYADAYRAALTGKVDEVPVISDETVAPVAANIEETTRDFVLKQLAQELKGHPLAHFVAHLLGTMGYRSRVAPEGPDGGVDIVAHKDELGFEPPIVKVQIKSTTGSISIGDVSSLSGSVGSMEFGLFVTLGVFTAQAWSFARGKSNLRLIDGEELVRLVLDHYDEFDTRYKGLLPLKRVFVPVSLTPSDE